MYIDLTNGSSFFWEKKECETFPIHTITELLLSMAIWVLWKVGLENHFWDLGVKCQIKNYDGLLLWVQKIIKHKLHKPHKLKIISLFDRWLFPFRVGIDKDMHWG